MSTEVTSIPASNSQSRRYVFNVCQVVQDFGRGFVEASSLEEAKVKIEGVIEDSFEDIDWYESNVLEQIVGADIHDESGRFLDQTDL